jgi:hypothetical protein
MYNAKAKKEENKRFAEEVTQMRTIYDGEKAKADEWQKKYEESKELEKTMTDKVKIAAQKKITAGFKANKDISTTRMKAIKTEYDTKVEAKKAQEEEEKFQKEL